MSDDIKDKTDSEISNGKEGLLLKIAFKPSEPGKILRPEETHLLHAYIGEILEEIKIEEKKIIEEERLAALEITARNSKKED